MFTEFKELKSAAEKKAGQKSAAVRTVYIEDFFSAALKHSVTLEIILPPWYDETPDYHFPLLVLNDGQLMEPMNMAGILKDAYLRNAIPPIIVAGVHAHNRMQEYGVAGVPDFKKRGSKADKYSRSIINELLPLIRKNFRVEKDPASVAVAGFSLGGLSAFDIAWNYPMHFGSAGVFSGSFWWRSRSLSSVYDDRYDRIMHRMVRSTDSKSNQSFWFQCGTEDETADRNQNGVIDSIDDTRDLISELLQTGFEMNKDIFYLEIVGGRHDEKTWASAMPHFLEWTFGNKKD